MLLSQRSRATWIGCALLLVACGDNERPNVLGNDAAANGDVAFDMGVRNDGAPTDANTDVPMAMCLVGQTNCNGVCVDMQSDNGNCGMCNVRCPATTMCLRGACTTLANDGGTDGTPTDIVTDNGAVTDAGTPADTSTVTDNGTVTDAGTPTDAGTLTDAAMDNGGCGAGEARCGIVCVSLATNPSHCGACGRGCASGQSCTGGVCVGAMDASMDTAPPPTDDGVVCTGGLVNCGGFCLNVSNDPSHCGRCSNVCAAGQTCSGGVCGGSATGCTGGLVSCGGFCLNVSNDPNHCGSCTTVCATGQACVGGACVAGPMDASTADTGATMDTGLTCASGQLACGGFCLNVSSDPNHCGSCSTVCAAGQSCSGGRCIGGSDGGAVMCASGQTNCGGFCTDLTADPGHCGTCSTACGTGQICTGSMCRTGTPDGGTGMVDAGTITCTGGLTACGTVCNDLQNDPNHCGTCTTVCPSGQFCSGGRCGTTGGGTGDAGTVTCTGGLTACGGACNDLTSDPNHCGTCTTVCSSSQICSAGRCVTAGGGDGGAVMCGSGLTNCSGACNDLQNDPSHCGTCTTVCPSGQFCSGGRCGTTGGGTGDAGTVTCTGGLTACGGACNDLTSDPNHCGTCTTVCSSSQICSAGRCVTAGGGDGGAVMCGSGLTNCSGACNDLQNDPNHCGTCTTVCPTGQFCSSGRCGTTGGGTGDAGSVTCMSGLTNCSGVCNDLTSDPNHCGTCTTVCPTGQVCSSSRCTSAMGDGGATCPAGFTLCSGTCVNLTSDPSHCGTCTTVCGSGQSCVSSTCGATCGDVGDPCCTAPGTLACPPGIMCVSGICDLPTTCARSGQPCCGGVYCAPGLTCSSGVCR